MTLDDLKRLMEADHPGATLEARDDFADALVSNAPALIACAEALQKILLSNECADNTHRQQVSFATAEAREALRRLEEV